MGIKRLIIWSKMSYEVVKMTSEVKKGGRKN